MRTRCVRVSDRSGVDAEIADHIEHVRRVAGIDHVGLSSDFDGIPARLWVLKGSINTRACWQSSCDAAGRVRKSPSMAGENMLSVLASFEKAAARLRADRNASEATFDGLDGSSKATNRIWVQAAPRRAIAVPP